MIDHKILKEVLNFLAYHERAYSDLVDIIREAAEEVQERRGRDVVHDIYSRAKRPGDRETKDPIKIAIKLRRKRIENPDCRIESINDIVGLTVSVTYNDYIASVVADLREALENRGISIGSPVDKPGPGYYATHIDCTAQVGALHGFMCEVQVKTMLHSAWGAKTHDLTYKPKGHHDHGLNQISSTIGDLIETIERQSGELHRLIRQQWEIERKTRDEATHRFFLGVTKHHPPAPENQATFDSFFQRLNTDADRIRTLTGKDPELKALQFQIGQIVKHERQAWQLAVALCRYTERGDQKRMAIRFVEIYRDGARLDLRNAATTAAKDAAEAALFVAITALYVLGAYEQTIIDSYDTLELTISDKCKSDIAFNLATYLIERECHLPSHEKDADAARNEIERLLSMKPDDLSQEIRETTDALRDIAFSNDPEVVQRAITTCGATLATAPEEEKEVAEAYSKYYIALGWRRLFRIR